MTAKSQPVIPYATQSIDQSDIDAVVKVLTSPFLTQGPVIAQFEQAFAKRHQVVHAYAVSNATAALHLGCLAFGVGVGDWVWTTPNSFVASANCALYCGGSVDFVDIDPDSRNMSVAALAQKLELADREGRLPKVVVPVHFGGLMCDLVGMRALADRYGFKILADASHAVGATAHGQPAGCDQAHASVFSFHPVKIVTTAEGGMFTTNDAQLAHKFSMLRTHGITRDEKLFAHPSHGQWYYEQQTLGFNYRMTELQAALGLSQLARLDSMAAKRQALADSYNDLLKSLPVKLPHVPAGVRSAWHLYVIELHDANRRAEVFAKLRAHGFGVNVHYIPIHLQPYYQQQFGFKRGDFPAAESYYDGAISIPLYPDLHVTDQLRFVQALTEFLT